MRTGIITSAAIALLALITTPAQAIITNADIMAWYRLDGNAMDSSGNNAHGIDGAAYISDPVRGTVGAFNGINGTIDVSASGFSVTEHPNLGFSTSFWIKPSARDDFAPGGAIDVNPIMGGTSGTRGVIEIVGQGSWGGMGGGAANGGVGVNSGGGAGSTGKVNSIDLYDGEWHHVLMQWVDPDGSVAGNDSADAMVYIDGVEANDVNGQTYNGNNGNTNAPQFVLGGPVVYSDGGAADKYYQGLMSDVVFFNRQLTPDEVAEAMAFPGTAPPPPPGPVVPNPYDVEVLNDNPIVYYRFEDVSAQAIDSSGNNNHGQYMGGILQGAPTATPELGTALAFDGQSGWVDVPALAPSGLPQSTIEFWVNAEALAAGCCTSVYSSDSFGNGNLHFNLKAGLDLEHAVAGGGPNNVNTPDGAIDFNEWAHVVVTYDTTAGGETIFYINGEEFAAGAHGSANLLTLIDGAIGAWNQNGNNPTRFFDGMLDEFAIYDTILSQERVLAHYNARLGVTQTGVPEPATATLAMLGLAGLTLRRRRQHAA